MDLLEYQAKELFREVGIPVPPSQRIEHPKDIKGLTIAYPIALKSQVYIGGRGRMGGVRFVENTIDAIAAAQSIFNLPIMGEYPKVLLAEAKYNVEREFYFAVILNRAIRRPVLLGSIKGGIDIQQHAEQIQHVVVEQEFSPYYARRLAIKMGLEGSLIRSVSDIVEKMYRLFASRDLDLVEINPLGISQTGELIALDGKVSVNDDALKRQTDLADLIVDSGGDGHNPQQTRCPVFLEPDGQIGILCNGTGLTLATVDLICGAGGKPAVFLNLGSETQTDSSAESLKEQLTQGLEQLAQIKQVRVLLVNLVTGLLSYSELETVIAAFLNRRSREPRGVSEIRPDTLITHTIRIPQMVVRLMGCPESETDDNNGTKTDLLSGAAQVAVVTSLDEAVAQTVALAKNNNHA
ncbi:MAG TPA: succinate--CoA ligase subunit beta [Leptolyngbyaceae cyanobacterium M33_DOE_097]|uniref:Succinate--CoA ligase subunit beta n=1 Tax=Oscillatoriales cyanobacterium SpSt-418 TaxID=2282169 RepID=A0A7C3PEU7_9CYAN|nr:succinate--CoA ligase subunit beta [Leptolyngbyaceae cyanobacterium M33_DOE_097]